MTGYPITRLPDLQAVLQPNPQYGSSWKRDVLAFGGRDRAAAADQDAEQRAFRAAEDPADDGADARARADLAGLALDPFALERLLHGRVDRIAAAAHGDLIERDGEAALAIRARGLVHRAHDAAQ